MKRLLRLAGRKIGLLGSGMLFKFNGSRRHKFAKAKYRVTNWAEYNEALRRRGDVTVWFSEGTVSEWCAKPLGKRGGQQRYSELAIEVCLTLRVVFGLPLRQTQGFVCSLLWLMELSSQCRITRRFAGVRHCSRLRLTPGWSVARSVAR